MVISTGMSKLVGQGGYGVDGWLTVCSCLVLATLLEFALIHVLLKSIPMMIKTTCMGNKAPISNQARQYLYFWNVYSTYLSPYQVTSIHWLKIGSLVQDWFLHCDSNIDSSLVFYNQYALINFFPCNQNITFPVTNCLLDSHASHKHFNPVVGITCTSKVYALRDLICILTCF